MATKSDADKAAEIVAWAKQNRPDMLKSIEAIAQMRDEMEPAKTMFALMSVAFDAGRAAA